MRWGGAGGREEGVDCVGGGAAWSIFEDNLKARDKG